MMVGPMRRVTAPVLRFTSVERVDHEPTFEAFAAHLGRKLVDERVRDNPRVVSLPLRVAR